MRWCSQSKEWVAAGGGALRHVPRWCTDPLQRLQRIVQQHSAGQLLGRLGFLCTSSLVCAATVLCVLARSYSAQPTGFQEPLLKPQLQLQQRAAHLLQKRFKMRPGKHSKQAMNLKSRWQVEDETFAQLDDAAALQHTLRQSFQSMHL